jgi:hypothetical protein
MENLSYGCLPSSQYPEVMTGGFFSRAGAARDDLKKMGFTTTHIGRGWSSPSAGEPTSPPDSTKILKVIGHVLLMHILDIHAITLTAEPLFR